MNQLRTPLLLLLWGILAAAFATALIAFIMLYKLESYVEATEFRRILEKLALKSTGVPASFEKISLDIHRPALEVSKWKTQHQMPGTRTAEFSADSMKLVYRWKPYFLRNTIELSRFEAKGSHLTVSRVRGGPFLLPIFLQEQPRSPWRRKDEDQQESLEIAMRSFSIEGGTMSAVDDTGFKLLDLQNVNVDGKIAEDDQENFTASGIVTAQEVRIGQVLTLERFRSDNVLYRRGDLILNSFDATIAKGQANGSISQSIRDPNAGFDYRLSLRKVDTAALLEQLWGKTGIISGKVDIESEWSGSALRPGNLSAKIMVYMNNGQILDAPVCRTISQMLRLPALAQPDFERLSLDLGFTAGHVSIQTLTLKSGLLEVTGTGTVDKKWNCECIVTIALSPDLVQQLPPAYAKEVNARADGYGLLTFSISGPLSAPEVKFTPVKPGDLPPVPPPMPDTVPAPPAGTDTAPPVSAPAQPQTLLIPRDFFRSSKIFGVLQQVPLRCSFLTCDPEPCV
ncbi:MAG: AsmA-like C-terminal region-containing protein [Candidatus Methylacidiphilales bacterium]